MVCVYFCLLKKEKKIHTDKAVPIPTPIPNEMILASKEASHKIITVIANNMLLNDIRNAPGLALYHGTMNTKVPILVIATSLISMIHLFIINYYLIYLFDSF